MDTAERKVAREQWQAQHPLLNAVVSAFVLIVLWLAAVLTIATAAHATAIVWRMGWDLVK